MSFVWVSNDEVNVITPCNDINGYKLITEKAIIIKDNIAVIFSNGHAVVDRIERSEIFPNDDFCYEYAWGYTEHIETFRYENEDEVYEKAWGLREAYGMMAQI